MRVMKNQNYAAEEIQDSVLEIRLALPNEEKLRKEMERTRKLLERRIKG